MKPTAWTIKLPDGGIWDHRAFSLRSQAHESAGSLWNHTQPMKGWKHAYQAGYRAVKCCVVEVTE